MGDTSIIAGAPLLFDRVRPGLDGVPYVIDTVEHSYSKSSGFLSKIVAKLYDGKSAGRPSGPGGGATEGTEPEAGTVAPDAPAGSRSDKQQRSDCAATRGNDHHPNERPTMSCQEGWRAVPVVSAHVLHSLSLKRCCSL